MIWVKFMSNNKIMNNSYWYGYNKCCRMFIDFGGRIIMVLEGKQRVFAIVFLLALAILITISA